MKNLNFKTVKINGKVWEVVNCDSIDIFPAIKGAYPNVMGFLVLKKPNGQKLYPAEAYKDGSFSVGR